MESDKTLIELAVLVHDSQAHQEPSAQSLGKSRDEQLKFIKEHVISTTAKETEKQLKVSVGEGLAMTEAAIAKRKLREKKRAEELARSTASASSVLGSELAIGTSNQSVRQSQDVQSAPDDLVNTATYPVIIPAASDNLGWYQPEAVTYSSIESAKIAGIWNYPTTLHERAKCGVFRELWEQGYFMGVGLRFGGDYLVYPGWFVVNTLAQPD